MNPNYPIIYSVTQILSYLSLIPVNDFTHSHFVVTFYSLNLLTVYNSVTSFTHSFYKITNFTHLLALFIYALYSVTSLMSS